ncbi:MAG: DUF1987 domain-containing protein [Chlorobi bacterium]|nr:DUF1987 domain-containing protein [Chlorobiota bacterium]
MEAIFIKGTTDTPEVNLDKKTGELMLKGSSLPEDVKEFYNPILNWLDEYFNEPNEQTDFIFEMVYFNTASSKMILDIMFKLKDAIEDGKNVKVSWNYFEDDEDMLEAGEDFADIVEMPIEVKCIYSSTV